MAMNAAAVMSALFVLICMTACHGAFACWDAASCADAVQSISHPVPHHTLALYKRPRRLCVKRFIAYWRRAPLVCYLCPCCALHHAMMMGQEMTGNGLNRQMMRIPNGVQNSRFLSSFPLIRQRPWYHPMPVQGSGIGC